MSKEEEEEDFLVTAVPLVGNGEAGNKGNTNPWTEWKFYFLGEMGRIDLIADESTLW